MGPNGPPMGPHGGPRGPMGPHGAPWAPMGAQGAQGTLFTGDFPIALRGLLGGAREAPQTSRMLDTEGRGNGTHGMGLHEDP